MKRFERGKDIIPDWILTSKEERKLSLDEKAEYYEKLCEYCKERKLVNSTMGATIIGPKLKKISNFLARKTSELLTGGKTEFITDGLENIPQGAVIFASSHQGVLDGFVWITDCPKHALVVHSAEASMGLLLAQYNTGLILVTKKREKWQSRINSKLDMLSALLKGHSIIIFPETAWNLSPNKLHLPFNYGFLDVAQKTGKPIVPIVMEFTYDTSGKKEKITKVHIRYGEPIVVEQSDSLGEKLEEFEEKISTMRWELIAEKGDFQRKEITNMDYINYMKGNLKNLEMGKIDINVERAGIQGAEQEFYKFHHINDVSWDAWGNLKNTEEVEKLKRINRIIRQRFYKNENSSI